MALYKRNGAWWIDISHHGRRVRRSAETAIKAEAQRLHDKLKSDLWKQENLKELPRKTWQDAAIRWIKESAHKRSLKTDKQHLRWIDPYLGNKYLDEIDNELIELIASEKEKTGVSASTVNGLLAIVRAILRKSQREWNWLREVPAVRMRKLNNKRVRWLTQEEAQRLLKELPPHLRDMVAFTLVTGLRQFNVTHLQWCDVDLEQRHAIVKAEVSKSKKPIAVPLNESAMAILSSWRGIDKTYVFTYHGKPVTWCGNHAWRKALRRAGIEDFRWHDLRHTWASWHAQNGTSLHELQVLGGWASHEMVLRYAHLSSNHLRAVAERINVTNLSQHSY